jgi:Flp pilus assembly protein TadD
MGRALSHEALGEEDAAEAALRQGLELAPRDARFHLKLAEHLLARADHFEAKSRLETSIGLGLSSAALRARAEAMLVILALRTRAIEAKRRGGR